MEIPYAKLDEDIIHNRARKILIDLAFRKLSLYDSQTIAEIERIEWLGQFQG